jgi:hypothetical protein
VLGALPTSRFHRRFGFSSNIKSTTETTSNASQQYTRVSKALLHQQSISLNINWIEGTYVGQNKFETRGKKCQFALGICATQFDAAANGALLTHSITPVERTKGENQHPTRLDSRSSVSSITRRDRVAPPSATPNIDAEPKNQKRPNLYSEVFLAGTFLSLINKIERNHFSSKEYIF